MIEDEQEVAMFGVSPVTATIGAEVTDIDLAEDLDGSTVSKLREALVEHKVLFFRDQNRLTPATHSAFGRRFGDLEIHPFRASVDGFPEVTVLEGQGVVKGRESWHSDTSFREKPSMSSVLRAIEVPAQGRDTIWADMEVLYEDLSSSTQRLLSGLTAYHDSGPHFTNEEGHQERIVAEHPIVRTHPESGRKSVFVNRVNTTAIVDMGERESAALLAFLFEQVHLPEYQVRLRWFPGTVAMWDNRSTQHYLVMDVTCRRIMNRVTIAGDRPV
jgi:taurine dioxygenase